MHPREIRDLLTSIAPGWDPIEIETGREGSTATLTLTGRINAGSDLELAAAVALITQAGGSIEVEKRFDAGVTFRITLPSDSAVARRSAAPPSGTSTRTRRQGSLNDSKPI